MIQELLTSTAGPIIVFTLGVVFGIGIYKQSEDYRLFKKIQENCPRDLRGVTAEELKIILTAPLHESLAMRQQIFMRRIPPPPPPPPKSYK